MPNKIVVYCLYITVFNINCYQTCLHWFWNLIACCFFKMLCPCKCGDGIPLLLNAKKKSKYLTITFCFKALFSPCLWKIQHWFYFKASKSITEIKMSYFCYYLLFCMTPPIRLFQLLCLLLVLNETLVAKILLFLYIITHPPSLK